MKKLRYLKTISGGTEVQTGSVFNIVDNEGLKIASVAITSTAAELNKLDGWAGAVADLTFATALKLLMTAGATEAEIITGKTLNIKDTSGLKIADVAFTGTAADLNLLSGFDATSKSIVKVYEEAVDCSGGGSAQTEALVTLPAGSIILEVITRCTEAFDGDTTKTFEVGIAANTDKYVDPVDCAVTLNGFQTMEDGTNNDQKVVEVVSASTPIIATWTNTANATAGAIMVKVIYI